MSKVPGTRTKGLALTAAVAFIAAQAAASPSDIMIGSAPKVGAEAPKAQDIPDGDVSVATTTGALQYSYPIVVPPGRHGLQLCCAPVS